MKARNSLSSPPVVHYYPVLLNLTGKKAVVVGGGRIAERKVLSLVKASANITVVSPSLTSRLLTEKKEKRIDHLPRPYKKGDLKGAFLVIAATNLPEVNQRVAKDASCLVNVVDVPRECNFIAPSVVRKGPLTIAISTSGTSPACSRAIRMELEKAYGREFSDYLMFVKKIREKAMAKFEDKDRRELFLKELASGDVLNTLREEGIIKVRQIVMERLKKAIAGQQIKRA